jgi:hypothetical protein
MPLLKWSASRKCNSRADAPQPFHSRRHTARLVHDLLRQWMEKSLNKKSPNATSFEEKPVTTEHFIEPAPLLFQTVRQQDLQLVK